MPRRIGISYQGDSEVRWTSHGRHVRSASTYEKSPATARPEGQHVIRVTPRRHSGSQKRRDVIHRLFRPPCPGIEPAGATVAEGRDGTWGNGGESGPRGVSRRHRGRWSRRVGAVGTGSGGRGQGRGGIGLQRRTGRGDRPGVEARLGDHGLRRTRLATGPGRRC